MRQQRAARPEQIRRYSRGAARAVSRMARLWLAALLLPGMLAGAARAEEDAGLFGFTFPAVMVVQSAQGFEEILTGQLTGYLSGNARFTLAGPYSGTCNGAASRSGDVTVVCETGLVFRQNVGRQRARMSGTTVVSGDWEGRPFTSALGWGRDADPVRLRSALGSGRAD
jgi:hypothetical protein